MVWWGLALNWISCKSWDDLPEGEWLVKISKDRKPYQVAEVSIHPQSRIVIVGNNFSWDIGDIVAYTAFDRYEGES